MLTIAEDESHGECKLPSAEMLAAPWKTCLK